VALIYSDGPCRRKLVGTRHEGAVWTSTVRELRKAACKTAELASWRPTCTPDSVGVPLLDILPELDPGELHTLEVLVAILARHSRR
jgi:hypothetical protein